MALVLDADEEALQGGVRALCVGRFSMEQVRALEEKGGVDAPRWKALVDTGVFSVRRPESEGGLGLGMAQAAIVFEELGRWLVPGPLVATEVGGQLLPEEVGAGRVLGLVDRRSEPLLVRHLPSLALLLVIDDDGVWAVGPSELPATAVTRPLDPLTPLFLVDQLPQGRRVGGAETVGRVLRPPARSGRPARRRALRV
ncbi:MAG: acyl-CoA dehydrogenase protein [Acidimicrobiales bacterium]|nr:acyl-CoA dehydrogenase protein [Acidimicrobiales bacterium]